MVSRKLVEMANLAVCCCEEGNGFQCSDNERESVSNETGLLHSQRSAAVNFACELSAVCDDRCVIMMEFEEGVEKVKLVGIFK